MVARVVIHWFLLFQLRGGGIVYIFQILYTIKRRCGTFSALYLGRIRVAYSEQPGLPRPDCPQCTVVGAIVERARQERQHAVLVEPSHSRWNQNILNSLLYCSPDQSGPRALTHPGTLHLQLRSCIRVMYVLGAILLKLHIKAEDTFNTGGWLATDKIGPAVG